MRDGALRIPADLASMRPRHYTAENVKSWRLNTIATLLQ